MRIRHDAKVGDAVGHPVLNAGIGHDNECLDFGSDIGVPEFSVGANPQNGSSFFRMSVPVHAAVVE